MKNATTPSMPIPSMAMTVTDDDLPSEEEMAALNLTPAQFPDFVKALKATLMHSWGATITDSCAVIGISRSSFYNDKWTLLFEKAQRLVTGRMMVGVQNTRNYVYDKWPKIVQRQVRIAESGEDKDSIAATALLYQMFPELGQRQTIDESAEVSYLKTKPNFSPMGPLTMIQAQAGSTVNVGDKHAEDIVIDMPTS